MTQKKTGKITKLPRPDNAPQRKVFVKGLLLDAFIGAYEHEQGVSQPLRIDFELDVTEPVNPVSDQLEDVVCYNKLTQSVKQIIDEGHIKLVETLAERVADLALSHPMVISVSVRIEKPNAIAEADAVGVEIYRTKTAG